MKNCLKCSKEIPTWQIVGEKKVNCCNRKFCFDCSPYGSKNTRDLTKPIEERTRLDKTYEAVKKFRRRKKAKAVEYKGGKCQICGYDKCYAALQFHHLDPDKKDFSIGNARSWGFSRIQDELDKCLLVCANCHAEIHQGMVG
jgi:hypothetical protein